MNRSAIQRCISEQAAASVALPDPGAWQGVTDWLMEEAILRTDYQRFLESKRVQVKPAGFEADAINPMLFPFQRYIVRWALRLGRAAIFSECGTGKTPMQLEWAGHVCDQTSLPVLVLAPLAVAQQTVEEGAKFGIEVRYVRHQSDVSDPCVYVTNYDMLKAFTPSKFGGVVLDESSILKAYTGATKRLILSMFAETRYKLACTATPAPNDHMELGNHAEFLGVMDSNEMLSRWFINDTMKAGGYRLKHSAESDFWAWVASWAVALERPSDIGFDDDGFNLPKLRIEQHTVSVDHSRDAGEMLFRSADLSATSLHKEMRLTAPERAATVARLIREDCKCLGRLSTTTIERLSITPTQNIDSEGSTPEEPQKRTPPTCESTISQTKSGGKALRKSANVRTLNGEKNTRPTSNTEIGKRPACASGKPAIQTSDSANDCESTGLAAMTTGDYPRSKAESARFAEALSVGGSTSIIATKPELFEDCCVQTATAGSAISKTIPPCSDRQWIIWCNTDYEQIEIEKWFPESALASIYGSMSPDKKESLLKAWLRKERLILLTKPTVAGYGLNLQQSSRMAFVGLSYSYEQLYQALRRSWRYGQRNEVEAHIVCADTEGPVLQAVREKQAAHERMKAQMVAAMRGRTETVSIGSYQPKHKGVLPTWMRRTA